MLSDALYEAARPLWDAQLAHPFVRGIGNGSLDEEKFKRWVRQDYRYLQEFARVFAWAAAKADRLESMSWYARVLELLAALLPCAWGYAYIGQQLAAGDRPPEEHYAEWVDQYASEEFAEAAAWLRHELDRLGDGLAPTSQARLTELFVLSSRYEWQFWEMCWQGEQWSPQIGLPVSLDTGRRVSRGFAAAVRPLVAAVIRDGDRLLVWEDHNPATGGIVCVPLAGGIEFGESGAEAVARELQEEISATVARADYLGTIEDIYDWDGQKRHELYLCYDVDLAEGGVYAAREVPVVEPDGTAYVARWRPLNDFRREARLVPDGLLELIDGLRDGAQ